MNFNLNNHRFKNGYITIEYNSLVGLMNKLEQIIIDTRYERVTLMDNGCVIVKLNGKYGLLNTLTEEVVPPKYDELHFMSDYFSFRINGKWGCLNEVGKETISALYDCLICFEDELATVSIENKYGVIDKNNKVVIPIDYDWMDQHSINKHFLFERNGKYGILNQQGQMVLQPMYDWIESINCPDDYMIVEKNDKYGVLEFRNNNIHEFIPCIYESWCFFDEKNRFHIGGSSEVMAQSLTLYKNGFRIIDDEITGKFCVTNKEEVIIPPLIYDDFDILVPYKSPIKHLRVKSNSQYALFSIKGDPLTDFVYDEIEYSKPEDLLIVRQGVLHGLLGSDGNVVIPVAYTTLFPIQNIDIVFFRQDSTWGFLKLNGDIINVYSYSKVEDNTLSIKDRCLVLNMNNSWNIYNFDQHKLIETANDHIDEFNNGLAIFRQFEKYGFIDTLGNIVVEAIYDKIFSYSDDLACVMIDDKCGFINRKGDVQIPIIYNNLSINSDCNINDLPF